MTDAEDFSSYFNSSPLVKEKLEARLKATYSTLRKIAKELNSSDTQSGYLQLQALFIRAHGSTYVTLPSTVPSSLARFVDTYRLNSAVIFSGPLINKALEKCSPAEQKLPVSSGRIYLYVAESLESATWEVARGWQSAALFREERLLVVWSGIPKHLELWARDVEGLLRKSVSIAWDQESADGADKCEINPTFFSPQITVDRLGAESLELSSANGVEDEEGGKSLERYLTYEDAVLIGLSLMSILIILIGVLGKELVTRSLRDSQWSRMAWIASFPLIGLFLLPIFCWGFFVLFQIMHACFDRENNLPTYSGKPPSLQAAYESGLRLPHLTIIVPVYKEGLRAIIMPTIHNLLLAVADYGMRGGNANIVVCDDGMQLLPEQEKEERMHFYAYHHVGWVARPKHGSAQGYMRVGKFKKASNLNNCFYLAKKVEDQMVMIYESHPSEEEVHDARVYEAQVYKEALKNVLEEDGQNWADGYIGIGSYVLITDSDSRIPQDALINAAVEAHLTPQIGLLYFPPESLQITFSVFENWASFAALGAIRRTVLNAKLGFSVQLPQNFLFINYKALRHISFTADGVSKLFSESCIMFETDLSLRLQIAGYIVRVANIITRPHDPFKEGVTLEVWDYLAMLEKNAYGAIELCFNPIWRWIYRTPLSPPFGALLWTSIPVAHKLWLVQKVWMYVDIALALPLIFAAYLYLGWSISTLPDLINIYYNITLLFLSTLLILSFVADIAWHIRYSTKSSKTTILLEHLKWLLPTITIDLGTSAYYLNSCLHFFLFIAMYWGATSKGHPIIWYIKALLVIKRHRKLVSLLVALTLVVLLFRFVLLEGWRIDGGLEIWPLTVWIVAHTAVLVFGIVT